MLKTIVKTPSESLGIKIPELYYTKVMNSINKEISSATEVNDKYGFHSSTRTYKSNIVSFTDRVLYIVSRIYNQLSMKTRLKGKFLCTDFSQNQLTELLGDCTRNRTKIGWQSIKDFLLNNGIIEIADKLYIHDSFLNKSQNIAYTLKGMKDLLVKPELRVSKNGKTYSSCHLFSVQDLTLVDYTITNKSLLKCIAKSQSITYDDETIVGRQLELITKYKVNVNDYKFVTNCISGVMEETYLFHEDRTKEGKVGECSLLKNLSKDKVDIADFRFRQSPYSSRIFSSLTSARKLARSFINFNDPDNVFIEFDLKSSQLVLAAFMYNKCKDTPDSYRTLKTIVTNDIYEIMARKVKKIDKRSGKIIGNYTREDMKKLAFKSIFSKRDYSENEFTKALSSLFPGFYQFLLEQKTGASKSKLAIKLQRLESSIFVGDYMYNFRTGLSQAKYLTDQQRNTRSKCILGQFYKNDIDAFSVHDSVLVNASQAARKFNIPLDDVWDRVIVPVILCVFKEKFLTMSIREELPMWLMGIKDEDDEVNYRRRSIGEMRLFSRYDNFNQFRPYTFKLIKEKYNTGLSFYEYEDYKNFVDKGDFRKIMYDNPDDESFWDTHDKNDPKYEAYIKQCEIDDDMGCPF